MADSNEKREDLLFIRQVIHAYRLKEQTDSKIEIPENISHLVEQAAIDYKEQQYGKRKRSRYLQITGFAVSVVVLFVLVFIGNRPLYTSSELFSAYYEVPHYKAFHSRGEAYLGVDKEKLLQQADSLYRQADFRRASAVYEEVVNGVAIEDIPESTLFYYASCLMKEQQYDRANTYFDYLRQSNLFKTGSIWYQALIYLEKGQKKKAELLLEELINAETLYTDWAKQLLIDLKKKKWQTYKRLIN